MCMPPSTTARGMTFGEINYILSSRRYINIIMIVLYVNNVRNNIMIVIKLTNKIETQIQKNVGIN